jgi:hypothetical protein
MLSPGVASAIESVYPDATLVWNVYQLNGKDISSGPIDVSSRYIINVGDYEKDPISMDVTLYEDADTTKSSMATWTDQFHVKYVRREIRSLTDDDREAFLYAMRDMYTLSTEEGQALYGSEWKNMDSFTALHLTTAGDTCDHLHDGFGFMNQHMYITKLMEEMLQKMNPSISMPYWDYMFEGRIADTFFGSDLYEWVQNTTYNTIFTDEMFGMTNETDGQLINSIFKEAMTVGWEDPSNPNSDTTVNSFGYMHAPWMVTNSDKVTRSFTDSCYTDYKDQYTVNKHFPTCSEFISTFAKRTSFFDWSLSIPYGPHGNLHRFLGTTGDCSEIFEELEEMGMSATVASTLRTRMFVTIKHLYHSGYLVVPDACDKESGNKVDSATGKVTSEPCVYSCPTLEDDLAGLTNTTLLDWMISATASDPSPDDPSSYVITVNSTGETFNLMTDDESAAYLRAVCAANVTYGDHGTASSSADISFWPVHPAVERFQHLALIDNNRNGVDWNITGEWPDKYVAWASIDAPECYGHHIDDYILALSADEGVLDRQYTNRDLIEAFDPIAKGDMLNYVFDHFNYDFCSTYEFQVDISDVSPTAAIYSGDCLAEACCGEGTVWDMSSFVCAALF